MCWRFPRCMASLRGAVFKRIKALSNQLQTGPGNAAIASALDPLLLLAGAPGSILVSVTMLVNSVMLFQLQQRTLLSETVRDVLCDLLRAARAVQPPGVHDGLVFAPSCHPFVLLCPGSTQAQPTALALAELLHEHGCTRNAQGQSFLHQMIHASGQASLLRSWLSPPFARLSMPNDWLSEVISAPVAPGTVVAHRADTERATIRVGDVAVDAELLVSLSQASGYSMRVSARTLAPVLRCAMDWWVATQQPKLARAIQTHLISDLVPEVLSFLMPESALAASRA